MPPGTRRWYRASPPTSRAPRNCRCACRCRRRRARARSTRTRPRRGTNISRAGKWSDMSDRRLRDVMLAAAVGSALEWYDFFLYAASSALVFGPLFFPQYDPAIGRLASFATFAVGFLSRPFGGLLFGHFGDRWGRKPMLVATLLLVGGSTFAIGLLPTYAQVGVWAPVLLLLLRLIP